MKNSFKSPVKLSYLKVVITSMVVIATFSACKKDKDDTTTTPAIDITFNAAYVVNGVSNNVSVIDLSNNTVKRTFSLNNAAYPHHVYLSPDKRFIAVAIAGVDLSGGHGGHGSGGVTKVMILDAVTGGIHHEISTMHLPHNAVFNPSSTELWIPQADTVQGTVLVYRVSDFTLQNTINVGKAPSELTFSSDGSMAFSANTMDGTVTMIDANSKAIMATIPVGMDPVGAWPAANGNMYVDNEGDQSVSEISVSGANVISTFNLGFKPGYVAYSTHHSEVWVTDATNGKVVFFENMSGVWTPVGNISTGADAHAIAFSSNGEKAYITNQGANTVTVIDVVNHAKLQDINVGTKPNGIVLKQ